MDFKSPSLFTEEVQRRHKSLRHQHLCIDVLCRILSRLPPLTSAPSENRSPSLSLQPPVLWEFQLQVELLQEEQSHQTRGHHRHPEGAWRQRAQVATRARCCDMMRALFFWTLHFFFFLPSCLMNSTVLQWQRILSWSLKLNVSVNKNTTISNWCRWSANGDLAFPSLAVQSPLSAARIRDGHLDCDAVNTEGELFKYLRHLPCYSVSLFQWLKEPQ